MYQCIYQVSKSGMLTQPSYRHKQLLCLRLFVVVVNMVLTSEWYCVPSLIVRNANNQVIGINISF